ncbi:MAG: glycosyltransferase family 1 protein, partial [Chloroflexi bacterium]
AGLSKLTGKPVVITHHGDLILPEGGLNRFIQNTMFFFYRFLARRASRIIAYSDDYANHSYYLQPYLDKVEPVYPPVHMPDPDPEVVARLRAEWQHDGGPVIGYPGRFVEEKRPDLLIRSLEVINQKYPNARVVFAGEYDIPYEGTWERHQALVQQYRDQLIFLGLIKDMQEMANFYAACDVMVLPSDTECFALAQVESMLCGTPMVMTDTPGGRVPVQATGMGRLVPRGDWRAIGEAVIDVYENLDKYVRTREEIESVFSFQETVDHYERIFREVVSK